MVPYWPKNLKLQVITRKYFVVVISNLQYLSGLLEFKAVTLSFGQSKRHRSISSSSGYPSNHHCLFLFPFIMLWPFEELWTSTAALISKELCQAAPKEGFTLFSVLSFLFNSSFYFFSQLCQETEKPPPDRWVRFFCLNLF